MERGVWYATRANGPKPLQNPPPKIGTCMVPYHWTLGQGCNQKPLVKGHNPYYGTVPLDSGLRSPGRSENVFSLKVPPLCRSTRPREG